MCYTVADEIDRMHQLQISKFNDIIMILIYKRYLKKMWSQTNLNIFKNIERMVGDNKIKIYTLLKFWWLNFDHW